MMDSLGYESDDLFLTSSCLLESTNQQLPSVPIADLLTDDVIEYTNDNRIPQDVPNDAAWSLDCSQIFNYDYDLQKRNFENRSTSCMYESEVRTDDSASTSSESPQPGSDCMAWNMDVNHLLSSGMTVGGFKPRQLIRKRRKNMVPHCEKTQMYWDKRRKNNESARKSREAKKEKEKSFYVRSLELEFENSYLKDRIAYLESQLAACQNPSTTMMTDMTEHY